MISYRRLAVWERAHALTLRVFSVTDGGALHRFPGLSAQLRRSVSAIPTNIAEGAGHHSQAQFNRFLEIALASAREADYQILLAKDLGLLPAKEYAHLEARLSEVQAMLVGLRKRVLESMPKEGVLDSREAGKAKRGGRKASPLTTHDPPRRGS
jgi:four helix bundle protein